MMRPWCAAYQRIRGTQNSIGIVTVGNLYAYACVGGDGLGAGEGRKRIFRARFGGNELKYGAIVKVLRAVEFDAQGAGVGAGTCGILVDGDPRYWKDAPVESTIQNIGLEVAVGDQVLGGSRGRVLIWKPGDQRGPYSGSAIEFMRSDQGIQKGKSFLGFERRTK